MKELLFFELDLKFQLCEFKPLQKNEILNIAPRATVSDKNAKCKQSEKRVNRGENHTKFISSPPKCKEMMESSVSEYVLLSEKLQRRNCPSKKNFTKIVKNGQLRIASGEILNSEVKMLPAGQVQKPSRTVYEMPQ